MKRFLFISILVFATVLVLMYKGTLRFGYGLGDIIYFMALGGWTAILVIALLIMAIKKVRKLRFQNWFIAIILFSYLLVFYRLTFGRGPEYRWDGKVFITGSIPGEQ